MQAIESTTHTRSNPRRRLISFIRRYARVIHRNHLRHHGRRSVSSLSRARKTAASQPLIIAAVRASASSISSSSTRLASFLGLPFSSILLAFDVLAQHFDGL